MKFISESHELESVQNVGGKGHHLQRLVSWKAPIAPFFMITTESFRFYSLNGKIPEEVEKRFKAFFLNHKAIALRSSMISEDHADASFAGLFETLLNVDEKNWEKSLFHIYDSIKSSRVIEYIKKKNLIVDLEMAVVAQELIRVEKSGVIFTRSPVVPTSAIAIDAAFGMGEGVVSGHADVDHYQYTRSGDRICHLGHNEREVLDETSIKILIDVSLSLEKKMGVPCDIEWGYKEGKLYVFQIRPITRKFEPLAYFVDTNLSESYPGTVSPFTASFVKKAYENVFYESAIMLGSKGEKLKILLSHYKKLISCVDDHLYYNLEHYYAALRPLPGGSKNIKNWHKMIGGNVDDDSIPYHPTESSTIELGWNLISFVKLIYARKNKFNKFLKNLEVTKVEIGLKTQQLSSPKETIIYLDNLINRPLGFGMAVVNDIFIMMGLGYLSKILIKKGIEESRVIDLLKTSSHLDSIRPLEHFNLLVHDLNDSFFEAFECLELKQGVEPYAEIFSELIQRGFHLEVIKLKAFIDEYGDRSFEELKLESLPMKNDPFLFKQLLRWARNNPSHTIPNMNAEFKINLNWLQKKVLCFTRESIAFRETARLWRGKYYHLLRQLVLRLIEQLNAQDESWSQFTISDYFSISHHEWKLFANEKLTKDDIHELMRKRVWSTKKKHYPEVIPWVENEPLPELKAENISGALAGQGVSPGVIEGIALVLDNPVDALVSEYKNFILVTKNTDPAWVYIMSRSGGLVSEKGSLLSHTAIIGRELNIPTVVGVKLATQKIMSGSRIKIDGTKGTVEIL